MYELFVDANQGLLACSDDLPAPLDEQPQQLVLGLERDRPQPGGALARHRGRVGIVGIALVAGP
jgi:hypothetical protein